jgi:hypothetical protein
MILDSNAQKGSNGLSINAEATIPIVQDDPGFGFFLKRTIWNR